MSDVTQILARLEDDDGWKSRSHFFGAAAEAMRRILVDNARRKNRLKRGGDAKRTQLNLDAVAVTQGDEMLETLGEGAKYCFPSS